MHLGKSPTKLLSGPYALRPSVRTQQGPRCSRTHRPRSAALRPRDVSSALRRENPGGAGITWRRRGQPTALLRAPSLLPPSFPPPFSPAIPPSFPPFSIHPPSFLKSTFPPSLLSSPSSFPSSYPLSLLPFIPSFPIPSSSFTFFLDSLSFPPLTLFLLPTFSLFHPFPPSPLSHLLPICLGPGCATWDTTHLGTEKGKSVCSHRSQTSTGLRTHSRQGGLEGTKPAHRRKPAWQY